jgi:hypothetical protein
VLPELGEETLIRCSTFVCCALVVGSFTLVLAAEAGGSHERSLPAKNGADAIEKIDGQEWPPIARGGWQLTSTTAAENGKPKISTRKTQACSDPSWMLATYWGTGILERRGCQFRSWKISANQFRLESVCRVRRLGSAHMKGTVVLETPDKFRIEGELSEGKRRVRITQVGQLVSSCPP